MPENGHSGTAQELAKNGSNYKFLLQKEKNDSQQALIGKVAEMTTLPNKFGALSLEKNGGGGDSLGDTPEPDQPMGGEGGESQPTSAENIVLNVEDRKRLTLADTAPKGGGIRRIITTDRS